MIVAETVRIRNARNEHLVIFRGPYPLPKPPQRDGIRERRMRKAKPCAARGGIAYVAQIVVKRNVLVVHARARAVMPRENTDAIGDTARRKHVNAVNAFKYPQKQTENRCRF